MRARRRPTLTAAALLATLAAAAAGCTAPTTPAPSAPPPTPQRTATPEPDPTTEPDPAPQADGLERAVWVHLFDDALKTRAGIAAVVADLVEADATAVIAEVVRRQDAYYTSDVLPRAADPDLEPGLDVLGVLIDEAHAAGIAVHAWVPVAPTWHEVYADLPAPDGWLTADHGQQAPEADRWVTRTVDGTWDTYLDPGLPEVRAHVAAVVGELTTRYPVDGVHLDYARYASERHGYHPRALDLYRAATGSTGVPDPTDPTWSQWRRDQVTALVRAARTAVDDADHSVTFSLAVISWGDGPGGATTPTFADTRAFTEALQDWPAWAVEGLVDALVPMNYFREAQQDQAGWLRTWLAFQADLAERTGTRVVPGIAGYLNSPADALAQIHMATRTAGAAAMYSYQGSTSDPDLTLWPDLAATAWGSLP